MTCPVGESMWACRFECVCAVLLAFAPSAGEARAQPSASGDTSSSPSSQIWLNITPGTTIGPRWYLELDVEPKAQVMEGEQWRNLDLTPLVEYYPSDWIDIEVEATVGYTRQSDGLSTFEVTPRVATRIHLFSKMITVHRPAIPGLKYERLPLTRLSISTLVRVEWRSFSFSDHAPDKHEWRARLRLEGKLALNHPRLSDDHTLYAIMDAEYFESLSGDIAESYVNKVRVRIGLGYRFADATKLELLYIRDSNRSPSGAKAAEDTQALDLRLKMLF